MNKMVCVIGTGYWGKNHIKTLYKLNALGGVVDLNNNTLKEYRVHIQELTLI